MSPVVDQQRVPTKGHRDFRRKCSADVVAGLGGRRRRDRRTDFIYIFRTGKGLQISILVLSTKP